MFIVMLLVVVFSGAVLCAQSAINGGLGSRVGVLSSAWLTFTLGALVMFIISFYAEPPHVSNLLTAPRWQVTGSFFGVVYMIVIVFAMPRVGTAAATVAVISGQLLMSLLIDNFGWLGNHVIPLGNSRIGAVALLAIALALIYKSNTVNAEKPTHVSAQLNER
jgi:transporter family-2 protein